MLRRNMDRPSGKRWSHNGVFARIVVGLAGEGLGAQDNHNRCDPSQGAPHGIPPASQKRRRARQIGRTKVAWSMATKKQQRRSLSAIGGRYFTSMGRCRGAQALKVPCGGFGSRSFSACKFPTRWRRRQRSRPERETFGLRNLRTTASRSSSDSRSACAPPPPALRRRQRRLQPCGVWIRSWTSRRLRHVQTVCSEIRGDPPPARPVHCSLGSQLGSSVSCGLLFAKRLACSYPVRTSRSIDFGINKADRRGST